MSNLVKCPKCGSSGLIAYGFFAACLSDDCDWVGAIAPIQSEELSRCALFGAFSNAHERVSQTALAPSIIIGRPFPDPSGPHEGNQISPSVTQGESKTGMAMIIGAPRGAHKKCSTLDQKKRIIAQSSLAFVNLQLLSNDAETKPPPGNYSSIAVAGDGVFVLDDYGFPPVKIKISSSSERGITDFQWDFCDEVSVWQPVDWSSISLSRQKLIRYLAVLQVDGQNLTYFVTEDLDSGKWRGGISTRKFKELEPTSVIMSSASNCEDAIGKLSRHYANAYNGLIESGDPIETSWSKEFGYEDNVMTACGEIFRSKAYDDDLTNQLLHLLGTDKKTEYYNQLNEELMRKKSE